MGKRLFDLVVAITLLVLLTPLFAVLAVLIAIFLGRPVLFVQERPGLGGRPFRLYKFRTMSNARDASGQLLPDPLRKTRFGGWLRAASLDELPELLNVVRGDMSLVGPRPLLMEYLPRYNAFERQRHDVRPGITGWAQVNGRNALSWERRFALDVWYVKHHTLMLDLKILVLTLRQVLRRDGIAAEGQFSCLPFLGSTPSEAYEAPCGEGRSSPSS